jgi:hypothetical protein
VCAVLLLLPGCGSVRSNPAGDRSDAAAYVRAAHEFLAGQGRARRDALSRVDRALGRCSPAVVGPRRSQVLEETEEFLVPVRGQLSLSAYRRLTAALASVGAHDRGLVDIARAAATIAAEDGKLGRPALDICDFLGAWSRTAWSPGFPGGFYVRLCRHAGYLPERVARAQDRIQASVLALDRLGLSPRQQLDLYTSLLSPLFATCNASR